MDALPHGQFAAKGFVRFGLGRFRNRRLDPDAPLSVFIGGNVANPIALSDGFQFLPRVEQRSDFHCVTTWSLRDLGWSGVRFSTFYHDFVVPHAAPQPGAEFVVFKGADGYRCALPLADLLADDVLLADRLDGAPLGIEHGAPLRLIAPAHYGYKNVKYLSAIEFRTSRRGYRFPFPYPGLMDHPRARVAHEERARWVPNWLIRPIYRLFVPRDIR